MEAYYIIIRGPLGIGKSTIAERLSKILNAKYVAIDRIVDNLKLITKEKEAGYRSQKNFIKANEIAVEKIKKILVNGKPVIFDGNFYWKSAIQDLEKRLRDYKGYVFTLKAPLKICIQRDDNRNKTHGKEVHGTGTQKSILEALATGISNFRRRTS
mgnify:CR=1 FL=1|tara:strand:+ start:409 stop:876 length:468 start_codon:yes stop_codon:yes gene_type:complete